MNILKYFKVIILYLWVLSNNIGFDSRLNK